MAADSPGPVNGAGASGFGLMARLLGAFGLVIVAAAATAWGVAAVIGPRVFHEHMLAAGVEPDHPAMVHAEQAFRSASGTSLTGALGVAVASALAASLWVARRAARSLGQLAAAAEAVATGEFSSRVQAPGLGREFAKLTDAFNDMAVDLAESQALRDRLIADVAHELRTPVATISGYLEAIEDGIVEATPETMALLGQQAERLTRLARDLVAVTRAEQGPADLEMETLGVGEVLEAAAGAARPAYRAKAVELTADGQTQGMAIRADRARLSQVLANLLDNALRHTPPGGWVRLSARVSAADDGPHLDGYAILIEVADSGEGIAPEHLPHIFERFYRADTARDRAHGGSGIGLAIAQALTEAQGGRIAARSAGPGLGAAVTVAFPGVRQPT
ncbi:MAG: HAMP domain-containing histidine kinase [Bifidobacteriaceae bacterium]|jgi:signal transduction histidine kinase|nr:HAMP domain-containing histidine kinase [Bifidobacteriaceae bacterium]